DGVEHDDLPPEWRSRLFEASNAEHVAGEERDGVLESVGRQGGYGRLPDPVTHPRRFRLRGRTLTVVDLLDGVGAHTLRWHFHFAPTVVVTPAERGVFELRFGPETMTFAAPLELAHQMTAAWVSPSYGVRVPCVAIDFELRTTLVADNPNEYIFTFV